MSTTSDEWNAALKAVLAKATTDREFRARCLQDGPAAMKEATGIEATGFRFSETKDGTSIVLPAFGSDPDELTELEQLDSVAGGDPGWTQPQSTYSTCTAHDGP